MEKKLKEFIKDRNKVVAVFILILLGVVIYIFISNSRKDETLIKEGQIKIQKGSKIVIVNENGLVEYRSEEGVFYDTWDASKTSTFFTRMETVARKYLQDPPDKIPENAYKVTLWIDGEIVVIYITEDDEVFDEIEELFEDFDDEEDDGDLGEYFDEDEDGDGEEDGPGASSPTPTTFSGQTSPTPTDPPYSGQGGSGEQSAQDCDLYGSLVTQRTVISNAICQIEENED